jgi:hypothetical protein
MNQVRIGLPEEEVIEYGTLIRFKFIFVVVIAEFQAVF